MKRTQGIILFSVDILLLTALLFATGGRQGYPYPAQLSYRYDFSGTDAEVTRTAVKNGQLQLPENSTDKAEGTRFLKIDVNASIGRHYVQPSIRLEEDDTSSLQTFEQGAQGSRYLNISHVSGRRPLTLIANHLHIHDQPAQLIHFPRRTVKDKTVLVIAPHPDDAEIAAYGLYSHAGRAFIVTITAGDAGPFKYDEIFTDRVQHYLKKGQLRTWNSITVPMLAGVPPQRSINLGYFDGTLTEMQSDPARIVQGRYTRTTDIDTFRHLNVSTLLDRRQVCANWQSLVGDLTALLTAIKPDIIVTPYPRLDHHPDHKLSTHALFEAIRTSGMQQGELFLYFNHFELNEFYPYGDEGGLITLPPQFDSGLYFDSIYSHPLSAADQRNKIFALEAMHDLRPDTEWRSLTGALRLANQAFLKLAAGRDNSYFKRSVRGNELFFVVNIAHLNNEAIRRRILGTGPKQ